MKDLEQQFHQFMRENTKHVTHYHQNRDLSSEHYALLADLSVAKSQIDWMLNALESLDNHGLIFRDKDELELARQVDANKDQEAA